MSRRRPLAAAIQLIAWCAVLGLALGLAGYQRWVHGSPLDPERWSTRSHLLRASVFGGVSVGEDGVRLRNRSELVLADLPEPVKLHALFRVRVPAGSSLEVHFRGNERVEEGAATEGARADDVPTKPAAKARTSGWAVVIDRASATPTAGIFQVVSGTWVTGPTLELDYADGDWIAGDVRVGEGVHGWIGGQPVQWSGDVAAARPTSVHFLSGVEPATVHTFKVASNTRGAPVAWTDVNLIAPRDHSPLAAMLAVLVGTCVAIALLAASRGLLAPHIRRPWDLHRAGPLYAPLVVLPLLTGLSWEWLTVRVGLEASAGADLPWLAAGLGVGCLHLLWIAAARRGADAGGHAVPGWGLRALAAWGLALAAAVAGGMLGVAPAAVLALAGVPALALALLPGRPSLAMAAGRVLALLLLFGCAEAAVRVSSLGATWAPGWLEIARERDVEGWIGSELDLAAAGIDLSPWTRGEPIPPAGSAYRIVCLGGSATQGWSDATSGAGLRAYPELLQDTLNSPAHPGRVQVLNQGFAGFNTLHIAAYHESFAADLAADLTTLYVGYNDLMTRWSSSPWREHAARAADRPAALRAIHAGLVRVRLLNGLAHLIRYRPPSREPVAGLSPAVPVDHARDNLSAVIERTLERGGRVLLLSEANLERGMEAEFAAYFAMLEGLVAAPDVDYLDTAAAMSADAGWFSDAVHPTQAGHRRLAELIAGRVRDSLGQGEHGPGDVAGQ